MTAQDDAALVERLIDTAETYVMQTHDRSGVTRRLIMEARQLLSRLREQSEAVGHCDGCDGSAHTTRHGPGIQCFRGCPPCPGIAAPDVGALRADQERHGPGQDLYNDLARRLITHILATDANVDEQMDVELRLISIVREREELRAENERLQKANENNLAGWMNDRMQLERQRDEARAEVKRLRARVEALEAEKADRDQCGMADGHGRRCAMGPNHSGRHSIDKARKLPRGP